MFYKSVVLISIFFIGRSYTLFTDKNACNTYEAYYIEDFSSQCFHNPDVGLKTPELLKLHTERYETHQVTTEDGYILTMFRIPKENSKGVVVLLHPLTTDSIVWLGQYNTSLAYIMSDAGYDVWLPNQRGTDYSIDHTNLTASDYAYWDWSFHEIGIYDYSTFIQYISNATNNTELVLISHSQSTTSSLIYAALKPEEVESRVKVMIEMSPITSLTYMRSPVRYAASLRNQILALTNFLKIGSFLRHDSLSGILFRMAINFPIPEMVPIGASLLHGWNPHEMDPRWLKSIGSHLPHGSSVKLMGHYAQYVKGRFDWYDYGPEGNLEHYNSTIPPLYPVENITVPVYIMVGKEDAVGTVKDGKVLYSRLQPSAKKYGMYETSGLNHVDFQYGKDRQTLLYDPILTLLKKILQ